MILKINPDKQKARALREMAKMSLERLNETNQEKYPSNTLTDYYDIMHKVMEALSLFKGIKARGEGAHKELIDFICDANEFSTQTREFLQQMRDYRNRIAYEGFIVHKNYIRLNKERINKIINSLLKDLEGI